MNIILLRDRIGWFGDHTGYEQLTSFMSRVGQGSVNTISPSGNTVRRLFGKLTSLALGHGRVNQAQAAARLEASLRLFYDRYSVLHILYGEDHIPYWRSYPRQLHSRTVVSIHQPPSQWTAEGIAHLRWVRHAILLYQRDLDFFRSAMPHAKIHFILHGVNINFFHPALSALSPTKRLLYNGVHLRNVSMLTRVVPEIVRRHPEVTFDFLVPKHRRDQASFGGLIQHPAITWHTGLEDEQLRLLYQQAYAMLLPMNDSGANTAIVEALACGLPIVTTDVGGIRDYGGGSIYPLVANNDDNAMLTLVEHHLKDPSWSRDLGLSGRMFAETKLAWPIVACQHADSYRDCPT